MHESITGNTSAETIGEIVVADFRTARVFENSGIDFCCGGKIDLATITWELEAVKSEPVDRSQDYSSWPLAFLIDYIFNIHHAYLKESLEQIAVDTRKIANVHGDQHLEVFRISTIFDKIATDLAAHMKEEDEVFFPAVKRADAAGIAGTTPDAMDLETIRVSVLTFYRKHEEIGDAVQSIRHLSNEYAIPEDVCTTFMVTYRKLKEFEDDLHKHVHLENNSLFPKATQLRSNLINTGIDSPAMIKED
jgi:regulator of cell morphogenesis and NO signaling